MTITQRRELPPAYPGHPHASEESRQIAEEGMILRVEVGSGVHGTALSGTDDRDELGICIEPPEYVTGLRRFEQYERHTAWDRVGGVRERSGAGDLDVTIYGARKFCRLALDGNPTIITTLFVPDSSIVFATSLGRLLLALSDSFVSLRAADRYLGYLHAQRRGMTGQGRVNRPELIAIHGYDTKFAAHAVRLAIQGIELMTQRRIHLPMKQVNREYLISIRRGEVPLYDVTTMLNALEGRLQRLRDENPHDIPAQPDRDIVNQWLHTAYLTTWADRDE